MATRPWSWRTPDARLRDIKYARQVEEERSAGLDEQDNQRLLGLQAEMETEQARGADLDRRDGIQEEMRFEQARSTELDRWERQETKRTRAAGMEQFREVEQRQQPPNLPRRVYPSGETGPMITPELQAREVSLGGGTPTWAVDRPSGIAQHLLDSKIRSFMEGGLSPDEAVREAQSNPILSPEQREEAANLYYKTGQAERQAAPDEQYFHEDVAKQYALITTGEKSIGAGFFKPMLPEPALEAIGGVPYAGPSLRREAEFLSSPGGMLAAAAFPQFTAVGGIGGIGAGAAANIAGAPPEVELGAQLAGNVLMPGAGLVPAGAVTGPARGGWRTAQELTGEAITRARLAPEAGGAFRPRGASGPGVPGVGPAGKYEPLGHFPRAGERVRDPVGNVEGVVEAIERTDAGFQRVVMRTDEGTRHTVVASGAEMENRLRAPVGPEDVARVTPEPRVGALEGGPPRPPREPPIGPRGPDPDDAQFRRIQDVAIKGEKPEMTLIRRHEGALQTARREAQIQVEEGNRLLRDANLGQSFRGTVAPRAGQTDEFDELYRFLHNPSRVEAGELVVPERLRPAYDKLRGLTDWEQAARLDFDPKMALIEDYFYRGWKPPEGMFAEGAPTRGPLGRKPGFRLPRVDATFEEMRAAGFEPLHWNPFEQWRNSRMMGVRYREQMRLVEDIKSLGLAEVHTGGPIPEGWRVPRVGSAFEGKPFAVVDEAGGARPMFTRRWIVPDTMADRLENIYGVAPQLGTVELAGRAVNLARVVDALVFIPKRAKLIASVFQHVDFLTRSHLGAWTGMVGALRHGRPISAVKHLAVWPNSARKILQATVSPGYRQNLRRMALDTSPLVPGRPGLTMRSVSEAGLSLQDVTILPANIDQIAREVAQEAVAAKVIKAPPRALAGFERVHRQGLFQGVYPAAILTDVQNNIAPIMVRNYPHLTDAQLAGQIAKVASTKYSTIPASMSAVQNRTLRGVLTRTFFSMGETEGLLRQATGALRGPQAAFWRDHWLGVYVGLIATANAIHFVSTGEPLPFARYSPISRTKWGPLPIGYNRDFASPNIPLTGRSGTEITLDLVGQLDTAFRILDPASFIGARESVPVRTAANQIKGTDFFGAPIDEVGPGGIVSRTSQLIFDMFAPIGFGQAGLELARNNIQGAERIIRPGEDRLGTTGTGVQATGVNLRAETTPQLLDRIRAEVMQEKGIEGRYEDIKATDAPLANEIDDEVEARIGPELEMRRETAEIRGQTTPQGQFFGEQEVSREQQKEEQLADDVKLSSGQWEGDVWRDKFRDRQRDFYNRREGLKQAFKIEFEDKEAPSGSVNAAIDAYFDVNIDDYAQPDGETNWDGFFEARDTALGGLPSSDRARVMKFIRKFDTPTVKEFRKAQEIVDKVYETPKYVGLSLEEGEAVDRILFEIVPRMQTAQLRQGAELERGQAVMAAISFVKDPDVAKFLLTNFGPRLSVRRRRRGGRTVTLEAPSVVNPERDAILLENQDILALFYPDLLAQQLSREQEAGLGERAFAAVQG